MVEKFDSMFHKKYVGGEGEIVEKELPTPSNTIEAETFEDLLAQYRKYVNDPKAELPKETVEELRLLGKV